MSLNRRVLAVIVAIVMMVSGTGVVTAVPSEHASCVAHFAVEHEPAAVAEQIDDVADWATQDECIPFPEP